MVTLVLSNPHSRRAAGQLAAIAGLTDVDHEVTRDRSDVRAIFAERRLTGADVLVLHGGDGTVQHAVTELVASAGDQPLPTLAVLPGGTTNMTARDLNRSRSFRDALVRLGGGRVEPASRHVVTVADGADQRCGFFFGAGAIVHGIRYFHERTAHAGPVDTALALGRGLWGVYRRQPPFADAVEVTLDGCERQRFLMLVTTLDRLINGTTPYWGGASGAMKLTSIEQDAEHFWRSFVRLLRGRAPRARGYSSTRVDTVRLGFDGPYTLDGEIFETQGRELHLAALPIKVWPL